MLLVGYPVVLELDEEIVPAEDVLQPAGCGDAPHRSSARSAWPTKAAEAPGGDDQPGVVALEQLPVNAGLVVVAGEKSLRGEANEVPITLRRLCQHGQVVIRLFPPVTIERLDTLRRREPDVPLATPSPCRARNRRLP